MRIGVVEPFHGELVGALPDMAMSHTSLIEGRDPYHEAQPGDRHVLASQWCVGATLKSAREAGGESLEEVAQSVRIRPEYLASIEEENYYGLPGWAHAVGYVRSYAMYLGLDSGPLVKRVRDQLALREHVFEQRANVATRDLARKLSLGAVAIVLGVLGVGLWTTGMVENAAGILRPVSGSIVTYLDSAFAAGNPTGPTLASAKTDAVPPPVRPPVSEFAPLASTLPVKPEIAVIAPAPANPIPRSQTIGPVQPGGMLGRPAEAEAGVLVVKPLPRHAIDRGALSYGKVTLRAKTRVWFRVQDAKGGVVAERELARGEVQRLPNVRNLVIAARDGGAIEYYVDGAYAGVLGSRGKSVQGLSLARLAMNSAGG